MFLKINQDTENKRLYNSKTKRQKLEKISVTWQRINTSYMKSAYIRQWQYLPQKKDNEGE